MALGVRLRMGADLGISITGIAGPEGGSPDKPVGTVWIGASFEGLTETRLLALTGDRETIRRAAALEALISGLKAVSTRV
jgi:PncC family amidohydrolase